MPAPTPKRTTSIAALATAVVLTAGCGPFGYLKKVAVDASRAVADAEKAGAQQYAPYEYWGAVTYLEQSKVLMAYSEYDRSFDYGDRAKQLAEEAKKKAQLREAGKMRTTIEDKKLEDEKKAAGSATSGGDVKAQPKAGGSGR